MQQKGFISNAVTKAFKLNSKQIQSFHKSHIFALITKKFGRLDQINTKQNAKLISTFDFNTLYTKLPHKDLLKVLFDLTDFGFNGGF